MAVIIIVLKGWQLEFNLIDCTTGVCVEILFMRGDFYVKFSYKTFFFVAIHLELVAVKDTSLE